MSPAPERLDGAAVLLAYIDAHNRGDADAIIALFAPDAEVEDPVGSPIMRRDAFAAFYRRGVAMGARLTLDAPIRRGAANAAAMAFTVSFESEGQTVSIRSLDVVTLDSAGRIASMKGYWGPEDVATAPAEAA